MSLRSLLYFHRLPPDIRRNVIRHLLFKLAGRTGNRTTKTARNLLRIIQYLPGLRIAGQNNDEVLLQLPVQPALMAYARTYPSSDLATLKEVWGRREYEPCLGMPGMPEIKNPLIVDIGSNVGYATLYFYHLFPDARITCVEPDAENCRQLKKNLEVNDLHHVTVIQGAWYNKHCRLEIKSDFRQGTHASYYVAESEKGYIQGLTFEELLPPDCQQVDLLKVDIEGSEQLLLEDSAIASPILSRVRRMAIEIHDDRADRKKILHTLHENGFITFSRGETTFAYRKDL